MHLNVTSAMRSLQKKRKLNDHIGNIHKKCSLCKRIFTTNKSLESHETAVHKKRQSKHKIERDPSMKITRTKETINQNFSELDI